jgi:hypothetical protein
VYNVEEAYVATIKESGAVFKKLRSYVDTQMKKVIAKGNFSLELRLRTVDYPLRDIMRLIEFLKYLGYKVESYDLTNETILISVQWTEAEVKNYLDNQ